MIIVLKRTELSHSSQLIWVNSPRRSLYRQLIFDTTFSKRDNAVRVRSTPAHTRYKKIDKFCDYSSCLKNKLSSFTHILLSKSSLHDETVLQK